MTMQHQKSIAESAYADAITNTETARPGADWFKTERSAAHAQIIEDGLPHRRMEAWRWTDLRSLIDGEFPPSAADAATADLVIPDPFAARERYSAIFVDGGFRADLSTMPEAADGLQIVSIAEVFDAPPTWLRDRMGAAYGQAGDSVSALNTAFLRDGIAIRLGEGASLDKPLELRFFNTASAPETNVNRVVVLLEEGARLDLLESHTGADDGRYVSNTVIEVDVRPRAHLEHVRLQDESKAAVHLANLHVALDEEATYRVFTLSSGARVARNQVFAKLGGAFGTLDVSGAYLIGGRQHCDSALRIDHAVADCNSFELFKCVMDGDARGIFQGKIIVRPDAQRTDGMQMSQALLLSERAEFDAKPELEIFADDVRCTHGATCGELDPDLLFYLRSRGIPETQAKALLVAAFAGEAIDKVEDETVREALKAFAARWLENRSD